MELVNKARRMINKLLLRRKSLRAEHKTRLQIERKIVSLYRVQEFPTEERHIVLSRQAIVEALDLKSTADYFEPFRLVLAIACDMIRDDFIYTLEHSNEEITVQRKYESIALRTNAIDVFLTAQYAAALDEIERHPFVF